MSAAATLPAATKAGDFLAVMVAQNKNSPSSAVTSVTDDAIGGSDTFVTANERATNSGCGIASEIWYARNIRSGARHVTVTLSSSNWFDVWVVEVSGLGVAGGADKGAVASSQPSSTLVSSPPVTPTGDPAFVVSVAQSCGTGSGVSGLNAGSPFTPIAALEGNGAAFLVATSAAPWGAVFDSGNNMWNASTAAFR